MSSARILFGSVMHRRLRPAQHRFVYPVFGLKPRYIGYFAVAHGHVEIGAHEYALACNINYSSRLQAIKVHLRSMPCKVLRWTFLLHFKLQRKNTLMPSRR